MLPTWVLILSLSTYQSTSILALPQTFTSQQDCEIAGKKWLGAHPEASSAMKATAVCVKVKD